MPEMTSQLRQETPKDDVIQRNQLRHYQCRDRRESKTDEKVHKLSLWKLFYCSFFLPILVRAIINSSDDITQNRSHQ